MIERLLYSISYKSSFKDKENILSLLETNPKAKVLDLGCGDGSWTKKVAQKIGTKNITGVDICRGNPCGCPPATFVHSNLNNKFPFPNNSFDVISANQIIEHIDNTDLFLSEIKRVLKPNGYAIISTENLSSWHNIFALVMGWQPPSIDHHHPFSHITVPIQPMHGHVKAFSYFGLIKLFQQYGFNIACVKPASYFSILSVIDPLHCHRITIKISKPANSQ